MSGPGAPRHPHTVLVVDDDSRCRAKVARMVREAGYQVVEAEHGMDAFRRLERSSGQQVHVVLTNTDVPRMSGARLIELVRQERPDVPIVLMADTPEDLHALVGEGAQVHTIMKPITRDELSHALRRVLGR